MGILFALLALISWGLGDFLIQRSTRKFGDWQTLFFITISGAIFTFPIIAGDLLALSFFQIMLLLFSSVVILIAALLDFEALKVGKISVVEPIYAFEVLITTVVAAIFIHELLNFWQLALLVLLMVGIFLVAAKNFSKFKKISLEKGVWLAIAATINMGLVNFLFGFSGRQTSPVMINWFISAVIAVACIIYLSYKKNWTEVGKNLRRQYPLILAVSFFDNLAWIAFAYSALFLPLAIATGISESYIALAALLGIIFNHEKLKRHQWIGFVIVVCTAIILAAITEMK